LNVANIAGHEGEATVCFVIIGDPIKGYRPICPKHIRARINDQDIVGRLILTSGPVECCAFENGVLERRIGTRRVEVVL